MRFPRRAPRPSRRRDVPRATFPLREAFPRARPSLELAGRERTQHRLHAFPLDGVCGRVRSALFLGAVFPHATFLRAIPAAAFLFAAPRWERCSSVQLQEPLPLRLPLLWEGDGDCVVAAACVAQPPRLLLRPNAVSLDYAVARLASGLRRLASLGIAPVVGAIRDRWQAPVRPRSQYLAFS